MTKPLRVPLVTPEPWETLKRFTDARIALGRAGLSLPTAAHLDFQLAHAQARDAVHRPLDAHGVAESIAALDPQAQPIFQLHSAAPDRLVYLQRPDLGRRLDAESLKTLDDWGQTDFASAKAFDLAFVVVDGLSSLAIHQNAAPLIAAVRALLRADPQHRWSIAPVSVVTQGRVAVGDEVGQALRARAVVVLIGERPGLSSPDSLGIYLSWAPRVGLSDAQRNCISNVRPAGLAVPLAAAKLHYLLTQSRVRKLTGVGLKDDADDVNALIVADTASSAIWHP